MADLPSHARVVIIGGGAVGCSALYHLAQEGWRDLLLLEKDELTSGSSWHAAGNCPNFVGSWSVMKLQNYSTRLYASLPDAVDYPMNYHQTGSIRLAHTKERMQEFRHVASMAQHQGIEIEMMGLNEMKDRAPELELHDLEGGLWDETDGDIDPAQLTQAFAKGARDLGAKIIRFCPVEGLTQQADGSWEIATPKGTVKADIVVNAAGYYAPEIGRMMGRDVPSVVMSHQYLVTEKIPELAARGRKLPLIRDPDVSYYLRQEGDGLILGPYEKQATPYWTTHDDPVPDNFAFQLWNDDLDRIEAYIEDACARLPLLGTAGIQRVINGPIPYAPDGNPLIGPVPGVKNAFEACVFTFGIVQAGGAGKVLSEWVVHGETEWDMWSCDPRRFTDFATRDFNIAKAIEIYSHEYATHFPNLEWPAGRPAKTSPLHDRFAAKGAEFSFRGGWEKPTYFKPEGFAARPETYERADWHDVVGAEVKAVHEGVGLLDLTAFGRFELKGPGAADWLRTMIAGPLPKPGRLTLSYFCTHGGRILTEMTVTRFAEDHFWLVTAVGAVWHDMDWLQRHMPGDAVFSLTDITDQWGSLVVAGPRSRDLLRDVIDVDLSNDAFKWLSHQPVEIARTRGVAQRVNYVGELGWEFHVPMPAMIGVYDAIHAAGGAHGLIDFGVHAMESMRLEKGYRAWKSDLSTDYSPLAGGLDRFLRLDKADFVGKAAIAAEAEAGRAENFVAMTVEANGVDAVYLSTIWKGEERVGLVTSGGYGHRIGKSIALGVVRADLAKEDETFEIEILGDRVAATVVADPIFDSTNERLRA